MYGIVQYSLDERMLPPAWRSSQVEIVLFLKTNKRKQYSEERRIIKIDRGTEERKDFVREREKKCRRKWED